MQKERALKDKEGKKSIWDADDDANVLKTRKLEDQKAFFMNSIDNENT